MSDNIYDKTYLDEVNINDIFEKLTDASKRISTLKELFVKIGTMDYDTKFKLLNLCDDINKVFDDEYSKELSNQKKSGKKFISDGEIDKIFKE